MAVHPPESQYVKHHMPSGQMEQGRGFRPQVARPGSVGMGMGARDYRGPSEGRHYNAGHQAEVDHGVENRTAYDAGPHPRPFPRGPSRGTEKRQPDRTRQSPPGTASRSGVSSLDDADRAPPPMCPIDLACQEINDPDHQESYRHTCRRQGCNFTWMKEHRRLFYHPGLDEDPDSPTLSRTSAGGSPPLIARQFDDNERPPPGNPAPRHRPPTAAPVKVPGRPMDGFSAPSSDFHDRRAGASGPLRPPPFDVSREEGVFARAAAPASPLRGSPKVMPQRAHPSPPRHAAPLTATYNPYGHDGRVARLHHGLDQELLQSTALPARSSGAGRDRRALVLRDLQGGSSAALSQVDAQLKEKLQGFALLKELENLSAEMRTLRHLHNFRHSLAREHGAGSVAYQIDHSARRVETALRRAARLQQRVDPDDVLHDRCDDEVRFAEELLAVVDGPAGAPAFVEEVGADEAPRLISATASQP
eukprot:TRINITY_DN16960_c0_g1_i1.p1 TRINITY_DN16960_c0_g1~~TRINITY_DN16960_c0_g1_i1.p1  ORF type:complete len:475 (+),score=131.11 TRINITY_DN16960_c0_g1_i1:108-1532(+)